jgi:hypothetical protein
MADEEEKGEGAVVQEQILCVWRIVTCLVLASSHNEGPCN